LRTNKNNVVEETASRALTDRIQTITASDFDERILHAQGPVAVEFMSYGCGHSRVIEPVLQKVAVSAPSATWRCKTPAIWVSRSRHRIGGVGEEARSSPLHGRCGCRSCCRPTGARRRQGHSDNGFGWHDGRNHLQGLASRRCLHNLGVGPEPIEITSMDLIFGERKVAGSLTGNPATGDATLSFSALSAVSPMIETLPLGQAAAAYAKMMAGKARFRMVVLTKYGADQATH